MGVKASASKTKTSEEGKSDQNVDANKFGTTDASSTGGYNSNQSGNVAATFGEEGQSLLKNLMGKFTADRPLTGQNTLSALSGQGGVNPYVEDSITRSNEEAQRMLGKQQAGVRAGNYRGGTGANIYAQEDTAGDFLSRLAGQNANTRMSAFNTGEDRRMAAAGTLSGAEQNQAALANQLLATLRGQSSNQNSTGTSFEDSISKFLENLKQNTNASYQKKGEETNVSASASFGG